MASDSMPSPTSTTITTSSPSQLSPPLSNANYDSQADTCVRIYAKEDPNQNEVKEHILFAHFAILTKSEYLRDRIKAMESTVLNSSDNNDLKAYELQLDLSMLPDALGSFKSFLKFLYGGELNLEEGRNSETLIYLAKLFGLSEFQLELISQLTKQQDLVQKFLDTQQQCQTSENSPSSTESGGPNPFAAALYPALSSLPAAGLLLNNLSDSNLSVSTALNNLVSPSCSTLANNQLYAAYFQLQSLLAQHHQLNGFFNPGSTVLASAMAAADPRLIQHHFSSARVDSQSPHAILREALSSLNPWLPSSQSSPSSQAVTTIATAAAALNKPSPIDSAPLHFVDMKTTSAGGKMLNRKGSSSSSYSPISATGASPPNSANSLSMPNSNNNGLLVPSNEKEGWCRNKKYIQIVKKGYRCMVCNKVYGRYNSVSYHVTIYHRNPPIRCEEEGCQFTTREARYIHFHKYYRHQIALPDSIDLATRKCPLMTCKHVSKSPAMLEKHIHRHVTDCFKEGVYYCCMELTVQEGDNKTDRSSKPYLESTRPICKFSSASHELMYEHMLSSHTVEGRISRPPSLPDPTKNSTTAKSLSAQKDDSPMAMESCPGLVEEARKTDIFPHEPAKDGNRDDPSTNESGKIDAKKARLLTVGNPGFQCNLCNYKGRSLANLEQHRMFKHSKQLFNLLSNSHLNGISTVTSQQQQQHNIPQSLKKENAGMKSAEEFNTLLSPSTNSVSVASSTLFPSTTALSSPVFSNFPTPFGTFASPLANILPIGAAGAAPSTTGIENAAQLLAQLAAAQRLQALLSFTTGGQMF